MEKENDNNSKDSIKQKKYRLRQRIKRILNKIDSQRYELATDLIQEKIQSLQEWTQAENILAYSATFGEIDLKEIYPLAYKYGKKIYLPEIGRKRNMRFRRWQLGDKLKVNRFGIKEPVKGDIWQSSKKYTKKKVPPGEVKSLMLVPGLGFSGNGHRLGRGGGYYDKFFGNRRLKNISVVGICFKEQIFQKIPVEEWDFKVDSLIVF